jgi:hypothetical protein
MKRLAALALVVMVATAVVSCGDDDDGPGQFKYPLKVGTNWYYTRSLFRGPDIDSLELDLQWQVRVTVAGEETLSVLGACTRINVEVSDRIDVYAGSEFYQQRGDGLYSVAGCLDVVMATPKISTQLGMWGDAIWSHLDLGAAAPCDGPIQVYDEPGLVFPYPISVGDVWLYRDISELGWRISKKITSWHRVFTPAGQFDAYQVEWIYEGGPDAQITDEVASVGLVSRSIVSDSVEIRTVENPEGTGEYETLVETMALDSLRQ